MISTEEVFQNYVKLTLYGSEAVNAFSNLPEKLSSNLASLAVASGLLFDSLRKI